jgi:hypothetical protein
MTSITQLKSLVYSNEFDLAIGSHYKLKCTANLADWRDGRVVDGGGLENRCGVTHRGFESLSLRSFLFAKGERKRATNRGEILAHHFLLFIFHFLSNFRTLVSRRFDVIKIDICAML